MSNLVTQQLREEITCGVGPTHARAAPSAPRLSAGTKLRRRA